MKRRRILFIALIAAALGGFAWLVLKPHEPSYDGKPLSAWLVDPDLLTNGDTNRPASVAFREMGTNALPVLLTILQSQSKPSRLQRVFTTLNDHQSFIKFPNDEPWKRKDAAKLALYAMGPKARPALPVLTNLLFQGNAMPSTSLALAGMGLDGVQALLTALTNQSWLIRNSAASGLGWERSEPEIVVPALIQCLSDSFVKVRHTAAWSLGQIHAQPELAVPALMTNLTVSNAGLRSMAAFSLGQFGTQAEAAVPALIKLLQDADPAVRECATNALQQIDPEAAAKAGVK